MDAPTKGGTVEVIDTVGNLVRENRALKLKVQFLTEDNGALRSVVEHLKRRKAHYKGITERVAVVLRAAILLDVDSIDKRVLADALEGDQPQIGGRS